MKMVSQLTREAMTRHRILSSDSAHLAPPPSSPPQSPQSPQFAPTGVIPDFSLPVQSPPPPRVHSIYSQLMKNHDRMTERHLNRT